MKTKRIFLIRHARSQPVDNEGRIRNCPGLNLTEEGVKQAEVLAELLKNSGIKEIYSSDLPRAYQTAEIIRGKISNEIDIITCEWLREFSVGELEGKYFWDYLDVIKNIFEKGEVNLNDKFPGGESMMELRNRVIPRLKETLENCEEKTAIITHGGVIRVIISEFLTFTPEVFSRIDQENASLNIIDYEKGRTLIRLLNLSAYDIIKSNIPVSAKFTL